MRALVVASMASRSPGFIEGLASACDVVIAADGGGSACLAADVVPDMLVGDLDSLDASDEEALRRAEVRFVTSPAKKDATDLDLALGEARRAGADEIWATGVLGGRLDHTLACIGSMSRHAVVRPRLMEPDANGWILSPNGRASLALDGPGALVSLFAIAGPARVSATGVEYPLAEDVLEELASRGLSNVITSQPATIRVSYGTLLVLSIPTDGTLLAQETPAGPSKE